MITTTAGGVLLAKARAGESEMLEITHISLGVGGIESGNPRTPDPSETELVDEIIKLEVTHLGRVDNTNKFSVELESDDCNGAAISEMGIWSDDTLIAIDTFSAKNKDASTTQTYTYEEVF